MIGSERRQMLRMRNDEKEHQHREEAFDLVQRPRRRISSNSAPSTSNTSTNTMSLRRLSKILRLLLVMITVFVESSGSAVVISWGREGGTKTIADHRLTNRATGSSSSSSTFLTNRQQLNQIRGGGGGDRGPFKISNKTKKKKGKAPLRQVQRPKLLQKQRQQKVVNKEPVDDPRIMMLIRLLFLSYYASLGSLLPYLPVYYHSLGHGGQIIGLLGAVKPFTTFLVAPVWGVISDQTEKPFLILQVTFLVSLVGQLLVCWRHDAYFLYTMVFLTALFNAPVKSLIDSMVMDHIHDPNVYGRLRLWGQMGFGLGSSAVGVILSKSQHIPWPETTSFSQEFEDMISEWPKRLQWLIEVADKCWSSLTGYKLLFFAHAALSIPTWVCIKAFRKLDKEERDNEENKKMTKSTRAVKSSSNSNKSGNNNTPRKRGIGEGLNILFHSGDVLLFFFLVLIVGISSGVIENFAYVRMREVGGTGKEMGLSRLVSSLAGAPMFWFSGPLTEALGADRVLVLSLLSYVTRFLIYAFMQNPYHGLPAEALRGVTFAAFWSCGTVYAHRVSPEGLHATMLMFLNAMYGGLGQSLGAIIGGKLQHRIGTVSTFIYAAIVDLCFVAVLVLYLSVRGSETSFKNPKPIVAPVKKSAATAPPTSSSITTRTAAAVRANKKSLLSSSRKKKDS